MTSNSSSNSFFEVLNRYEILEAIVLILFGFVLIAYPGVSMDFLCLAIGVLLIVVGGIHILSYFFGNVRSTPDLFGGLLQLIVGIVFVVQPTVFYSIAMMIVALMILYGGLRHLKTGLDLMKAKARLGLPVLLLSIVAIILAFLVYLYPAFIMLNIFVFSGICAVYTGVQMLIAVYARKRFMDHAYRNVKNSAL